MRKILIIITFISVFFTSCKKDFLEQKPYNGVPFADAVKDEPSMQAALIGTYRAMRTAGFYARAVPVIGDLLADNAFISTQNSNRLTSFHNINYTDASADAQGIFAGAYNVILRTNNIINSPLAANATINQLKGEALTLRALCYFTLIQWFAKPFTVDPDAPGVPLVLEYDPNLKPSRVAVKEIYNQIEKDLNDAFGLLTITKNSGFVTKFVPKALLTRVYQAKGEWTKCRDAALEVVNSGGYSVVAGSSLVSFWANPGLRTDKVEVIFEISEDAVNNSGTDAIGYFYSQAGYGDALATDDLYNQYSASDFRRSLFLSATRAGLSVKVVNKYSNSTNTADRDNIKVIRYSEIILTLAEAYYRLADENNARIRLNQIATNRDPLFAGYNSAGTTLLNDILKERRKELAFEGLRYYDHQRLGLDVMRVNLNNNYSANVPLIFEASNFRRLFPIPLTELDANPNARPQNPGY